MPELGLHFAVCFALTAPVLGLRRAAVISLVSLMPDLDVLFHVHRSASHSAILILAVCLVVVGLTVRLRPRLLGLVSAASLALLSHPIMDMFSTYTPVLYPLTNESVYVNVEWKALIGWSILANSVVKIDRRPTEFVSFDRLAAPIFSSEGFIVFLILVAIPCLEVFVRRLRTPKLSESERTGQQCFSSYVHGLVSELQAVGHEYVSRSKQIVMKSRSMSC